MDFEGKGIQDLLLGKDPLKKKEEEELMSTGTPDSTDNIVAREPAAVNEDDLKVELGDTQIAPVNTPKEMSQYEKLIEDYRNQLKSPDKETTSDDKVMNWLTALGQIGASEAKLRNRVVPQGKYWDSQETKGLNKAKEKDLVGTEKLLKLMRDLSPKDRKNIYKVGNDLVKVGDDGQVQKLYGKEEKKDSVKLTEAEKVVDKEFAKEYNKWATGGKADYEVNSKIFKDAIRDLKKGTVDTGPLEGIGARTPILRTDARATEDKVRKAINGMLRATLGAQFTEKEGERIFQQTFDPFKDSEDNIAAMELELAKIEKRKDAMESMGDYYKKNKSLSGFSVPKTSAKREISPKDKKAMDWLKQNPDHPSAEKIKMSLINKGLM